MLDSQGYGAVYASALDAAGMFGVIIPPAFVEFGHVKIRPPLTLPRLARLGEHHLTLHILVTYGTRLGGELPPEVYICTAPSVIAPLSF